MKIAITLPIYINNEDHLFFTEQTLDSIQTKYDYEILLVENYINPALKDQYDDFLARLINSGKEWYSLKNPYGNNVSGGWNTGIKRAFEDNIDFVIIPNNDIIFHHQCIDNLVQFWLDTKDKFLMWTAGQHADMRTLQSTVPGDSYDNHPGFSLMAISRDSIEYLREKEEGTKEPIPGYFDPGYTGAYFEDQDYHQRILRAGRDGGKTASALYYHFGSRTIKVDSDINTKNFHTYEHNRQYFAEKWGYDGHGKGFSNEERLEIGNPKAFEKE